MKIPRQDRNEIAHLVTSAGLEPTLRPIRLQTEPFPRVIAKKTYIFCFSNFALTPSPNSSSSFASGPMDHY
jgi:hypothetical protein